MSNASNSKNQTSSISDISGLFNNLIVAPLTIKIPALNSLRRAGSRIPPVARSEEGDKGKEEDGEETEKEEEDKEEEENNDDLEEVQIILNLNPSKNEENASLNVGNIASPKSHDGVRSRPKILNSNNQSIAEAALVSSTSEVVPPKRNESSSSSTSVQVKTKAPSQFLLEAVTDELENPPHTEITLAQRHGAREERLPGQSMISHTSTASRPGSDVPRPATARVHHPRHREKKDLLGPTPQSEKVELANLRKERRNRNSSRKTRRVEEDSPSHYSQRNISSGERPLASRIAPRLVSGSSRAAKVTKDTETLVHRHSSSRYSSSPYQIGVRRTRPGRSDAFPDERILANTTSIADPLSSEASGAPYSVSAFQRSNPPNKIANTIRSFPRSTPDDGNLADYEDESPIVQPVGPTFVHKPLEKSASAMSVDDVVLPAPRNGGTLVKTDSMMSVDVPITASGTRALTKSESDMSIVIEDQPTAFGGAFVQQTQSLQKCASVTMVDACDIRAYDTNGDNKIMNMDTESQNTPTTGPMNAPVFSPTPAQTAFPGHWIYQNAPGEAFAHAAASSAYQPTAPIQHQYQSTFPEPQQQPHPSVAMEDISRAFTDPPDISSAIPRPLNKLDPSPPLPPSQSEPTMFKPLPRQDTFWNEVQRTTLKVSQTRYRSPQNRGGQKRSWDNAGHWASMDQDASQIHRRRRIDPHLNHDSHEILPASPRQPLRGLPIRKKDRRTRLKDGQDRETPIDSRHRCCGSGILRCINYVVDSCTAITKS
ncbi:hypothetical protein F5876DRAFT_76458 [Lentinula aff. lateritia]|uniref:Uncharacterized protein n=1 Tax=Lentinula aff. lateritia TaxID=2804960 RepID=A0ACC1U177_9AGAR|nr:hypothetical protein F5876DRAFT_76458 [Lentinula aff. lateritia]